jgi:hypothetical protein
MERMNLREAAERTYRSVTTLRRYIRSGRLRAEKRDGRYGPEYFVREADLEEAGLFVEDIEPEETETKDTRLERRPAAPPAHRVSAADAVPLSLFQELQWKHEQLLVQYGMMRAGGLRAVELREQLAEREREIERLEQEARRLRNSASEATRSLQAELRETRFELEGRTLEAAALREKVRALEMLTRNQVTSESIEDQYRELFRQVRRVGRRSSSSSTPRESERGNSEERPAARSPRPWLVRDVPPDGDH